MIARGYMSLSRAFGPRERLGGAAFVGWGAAHAN